VCLFHQRFSDFKSKKIRVPIKAEIKAESRDVLKMVANTLSRRLLSGAPFSIPLFPTVLMKSACPTQHHESAEDNEKPTSHTEVISQISQRFTPKIPDIKKVRFLLP
jgi:cullin 1